MSCKPLSLTKPLLSHQKRTKSNKDKFLDKLCEIVVKVWKMKSLLTLCLVLVISLSTCHSVVDVEYVRKMESNHKGDQFGSSLAASHHKVVIGAPTAR